jgi:hypothetical protein
VDCFHQYCPNNSLTENTPRHNFTFPQPLLPPPLSIPGLSWMCRIAIRHWVNAIIPQRKEDITLTRMCDVLIEHGPTTIKCLEPVHLPIASLAFQQYCRCRFAKCLLGDIWGTAKAEESIFHDPSTNQTKRAVDFIREGFPFMK